MLQLKEFADAPWASLCILVLPSSIGLFGPIRMRAYSLVPQTWSLRNKGFLLEYDRELGSTIALASGSGGCLEQPFQQSGPKCFLAITCSMWLHLEFWRRGSAWFFGPHLFGFRPRGLIFGPRNQTLDPGFGNWAPAGLERFGEGKWGLEKHGFVEEWFRNWRLGDFP